MEKHLRIRMLMLALKARTLEQKTAELREELLKAGA